jgi:hypothetical protein
LLEQVKVLIVVTVETFFAHEAPQALNEIEIGGIGRQKEHLDVQLRGPLKHETAALIASVIHHQGNGCLQTQGGDLLKEFTHTSRVDVAVIGHGNELMGDGMQGPQDVKALPTAGSTHDHTGETPQPAQIRSQDKMGRIDEKDRSLTGSGLL